MSTKIYDAYRISKGVDILKILTESKGLFTKEVSENKDLLYMIDAETTFEAHEELEKNSENFIAKGVLKDSKRNRIDDFWIEKCLLEYERSIEKKPADVAVNVSVLYDDNYWYLKFFINSNWAYKVMEEMVKEYGMEDFHYQNQVDPPEDVDEDEFYSRIDVWDSLLGENGNYRNAFNFTLFDAYEFRKLLSRNYFKGYKTNEELYSHLAYKFDKIT